jgi:hypothetical protein
MPPPMANGIDTSEWPKSRLFISNIGRTPAISPSRRATR